MSYNWNKFARIAAIGAACLLAGWIGTTSAKEEASVLVNKPAEAAATAQAGPAVPQLVIPTAPLATKAEDLPPPVPPQAAQPSNSTVKRPFMRPAEPRLPAKGKLVGAEPMPAPADDTPATIGPVAPASPSAVDVTVKPTPPIEYDTDGDARRMYRSGKISIVMLTQDPSDGCAYEIPLCIPACCEGEAKMSCGRGIFGRGVVEYCWPCGFRAIVKFRHVLGDVKVEYEGD
jgi:hypothetical protein